MIIGVFVGFSCIPLNAELNPICHLLALLGGATIVVVSRLRVKQRLKCNTGKVCNCLIQFLLTMVISIEEPVYISSVYISAVCISAVCISAVCISAVCINAVCISAVCISAVCISAVC